MRFSAHKDEELLYKVKSKKSRYLHPCNPFKTKEYSYEIWVTYRDNKIASIFHGLFFEGYFLSGQQLFILDNKAVLAWEGINQLKKEADFLEYKSGFLTVV